MERLKVPERERLERLIDTQPRQEMRMACEALAQAIGFQTADALLDVHSLLLASAGFIRDNRLPPPAIAAVWPLCRVLRDNHDYLYDPEYDNKQKLLAKRIRSARQLLAAHGYKVIPPPWQHKLQGGE